ncbi:MAG: helix-turn-helix transcriptional regulator [Gaiellaceae bacterium]
MDALEAVGDPELRAALVWVRAQAQPVTADELAEADGVHRNVARSRLERLVAAGLLAAHYERRTGRTGPGAGRPAKIYSVAPQLENIEFPTRQYESLFGLLLAELPRAGRPERLRAIGVEFGGRLAQAAGLRPAKRARTGLERMCAAVRRLGYQATLLELADGRAVVATPMCPLRPLVREQPDAALVDRGMWAGLASAALAATDATAFSCDTRDCLDDHSNCRVYLTLHP